MTLPDSSLPPELRPPRRRRGPVVAIVAAVAVLVAAVLAFGVFEVQALFIDDEVSEAGPVFASGATAPAAPPEAGGGTSDTTAPASTDAGVPAVTMVSSGTFESRGHPGAGTVTLLTDGTQTFARFEDDFATDNGPDLRVRAVVDGQRVDLGELKGNQGAQNYELPAAIDPTTVTAVDVWCRRFDYIFTEAAVS